MRAAWRCPAHRGVVPVLAMVALSSVLRRMAGLVPSPGTAHPFYLIIMSKSASSFLWQMPWPELDIWL